MAKHDIFLVSELSKVEEDIIRETFSNPTVIKYLQLLGANDAKELLSLSSIGMGNEALAKAHATIHGRLQVIYTLLEIGDSSTTN